MSKKALPLKTIKLLKQAKMELASKPETEAVLKKVDRAIVNLERYTLGGANHISKDRIMKYIGMAIKLLPSIINALDKFH